MIPRAVANVLIACFIGALVFAAVVGIRNEISELRNPSPEKLTTKFFGACVSLQKYSQSTKASGFTAHQIDTYCRCYAESLLELTTIEERRYFALNETAPLGFEPKMLQAADKCFSLVDH